MRYTMTIEDVEAWRINDDGDLSPDAAKVIESVGGWRVQRTRDEREMGVYERIRDAVPTFPVMGESVDYWIWNGENGMERAGAGEWIVRHEYGVVAMTDEYFRSCCTESESE